MSFDNHRTSAVDGKSSGSSSDAHSPAASAAPSLCHAGCGFFGNSAFDGMCSKCYKELQQNASAAAAGSGATASTTSTGVQTSLVEVSSPSSTAASSSAAIQPGATVDAGAAIPSIETGLPTVRSNASLASRETVDSTDNESEVGDTHSDAGSDQPQKKKRCAMCKKRVGLTGFDCRCGGHFCSTHRYSDSHKCDFNYHALAQTEIRKHNPIIAAEKVKKI